LNTDRRRIVPGTYHYSFLFTATSSILFDGKAQGQRTRAGAEAAQENDRGLDQYGDTLIMKKT
jgi:hypothetical protein